MVSEPIHARIGLERPDKFDEIFKEKALLRKHMNKNHKPELYLQLSSKYFSKSCIISQLLSKVL